MAWTLKGSYFETCSCELMCRIAEGDVDGTDIGGRTVAMIADTPKVMTEGNWRLGAFVDDGADDEQFEKLVQVFTGQLGGPMAALAPLVGEVLGAERATI